MNLLLKTADQERCVLFFFFILSHEEVEASVDVEDLVDDDGDRGG